MFRASSLVRVAVLAVALAFFFLGRLVDDSRLGGDECKPLRTNRWVKAEDHSGG